MQCNITTSLIVSLSENGFGLDELIYRMEENVGGSNPPFTLIYTPRVGDKVGDGKSREIGAMCREGCAEGFLRSRQKIFHRVAMPFQLQR